MSSEKMAEQAGHQQINQAVTNELLQKVYKFAPDCIPAQLLEAKLEMAQGN